MKENDNIKMCCSKPPPFVLLELPDITESINYPLKTAQRIKYTCFDVSRNLIAFGATSGGIYVFNRNPCEFIQLLPNKDGAITRLSISNNEKHIAFANGKGVIKVTECNQSLSTGHSIVSSKKHQGNEVTAMAWSNNTLFSGDDIGRIAVLQLQSFIAKTMFQSASQTIMNLDSRICQIDVKSDMLVVSTLTRCYICDTNEEQYRQIGQKMRDGEFGACFINKEKNSELPVVSVKDYSEARTYNIASDDVDFTVGKELKNTSIFCARPSSRLWEASVDGIVKRTHQFKQVLGNKSSTVVNANSYETERFPLDEIKVDEEGRSVNFAKIYSVNGVIFAYKKDAIYFLNVENVDHTVWFDKYNDILDCKVYHDMVYIWLHSGSLINLKFMKLDKFLVKCYVDEKYNLCTEVCTLYSDYLLSNDLSAKLTILAGLSNKVQNKELLIKIDSVLEKFEKLKVNDATQMKSGIYVVDNTYNAQSSLLDDDIDISKNDDYNRFVAIPPEAMQTLKDLTITMSDKLNTSKKILKEKWEDFEEKMKYLNIEKQEVQVINTPKIAQRDILTIEVSPTKLDNDIIYKEPSQKTIEVDNDSLERDKLCKSLYQYFRLSLVDKDCDQTSLISIIENYTCDITKIYDIMLHLERYCASIGALEESKFIPNNIFLNYLNTADKTNDYLNNIIEDEVLYKYFVDSCIVVNMKIQKLLNMGCKCGFPLPYVRTNRKPVFSDLINRFIERQWSNQTKEQCYDVCRKMPYLWRKILYLRRNEDLLKILRLLLQMLDENLLHSFLPQFTIDTWHTTVQLYATLHANICLNCSRKFDNISVRDMLSWDDLGRLMIKSIGGRKAIKVMEVHAKLIDSGLLTLRFYHTCLLVTMFEKYDSTLVTQLTDVLYNAYNYADARNEIYKLLRDTPKGILKHTALPITIAAKSTHWGLQISEDIIPKLDLVEILNDLSGKDVTDCSLCGLQLKNEVLIQDGGLWVFKCGHIFHGPCLDLIKVKLCPSCSPVK